jgi:hypothetical protein
LIGFPSSTNTVVLKWDTLNCFEPFPVPEFSVLE